MGRIVGHFFSTVLSLGEMQTALSRIWTQAATSISYDNLSLSLSLYIYIYIYIYTHTHTHSHTHTYIYIYIYIYFVILLKLFHCTQTSCFRTKTIVKRTRKNTQNQSSKKKACKPSFKLNQVKFRDIPILHNPTLPKRLNYSILHKIFYHLRLA